MLLTLLAGACGVIVIAILVLMVYMHTNKGTCTSQADLTGKTVLITGANTGIGYYTALDLARRNARVILACRDQTKGQAAVDSIQKASNNQNVTLRIVDLSLMKSVREFATAVIKEESRIDVLINNAAVGGIPLTMTEEGLETTLATNYFGHFLLTNLLLDLLKKSSPSRIVNVSSLGHKFIQHLEFDKLNTEKHFTKLEMYQTSKLCNVLMTRELACRLENTDLLKKSSPSRIVNVSSLVHKWVKVLDCDNLRAQKSYHPGKSYWQSKICNVLFTRELACRLENTGVTTYSLHPGTVATDIWRHVPPFYTTLMALAKYLYFKSSEEGAQTTIYCSVSEDVADQSGKYYVDCAEAEDQSSDLAKDMGLAKKLWEISEKYTGLDGQTTAQ